MDWAVTRPEINPRKIAVLGISFGAFVAALAMGVEERISAGILIEGGGNSVRMNQLSRVMRAHYPGPPLDHKTLLKEYDEYLGQLAEQGLDKVEPSHRSFLTDPLTYASRLKKRPLLMINALYDELIPRRAALELWQASGRQFIFWLPGTHVTLWLWYPLIQRQVRSFLQAVFQQCGN